MKFLHLTFFALLCAQTAYAQPLEPTPKKNYTDSEGKLYWNRESPVYLRISDSPDDAGQLLKSQQHPQYTNPYYLDTEGVNYIRTRYAVDPSTRQTITPEIEVLWEIYADGTAPASTLRYSDTPTYEKEGTVYYGKGLTATLTSTDALSGVSATYVSVNQESYRTYQEPVAFTEDGSYTVKYYATDHVGNTATPKETRFQLDVTAPKTYYNVNGISEGNTLGTASKIYLTREDAGAGVSETYYQLNDEAEKRYNGRDVPFTYLPDGRHVLTFYSKDNVGNIEEKQTFEFYFDKTAPIVAADVLGDRFIANDQVYFSGRTKLKLTAVDNKSGVKDVLFSVDNADFQSYTEPFYLPSVAGIHVIRYYSLDEMGNQSEGQRSARYEEFKHNVSKVYVDLTGPSLSYKYSEGPMFLARDTVFVSPTTKIKLEGKDNESGLQYVSYSINGTLEETTYEQPFSVAQGGLQKVEVFGYDNVNNRNILDFFFVVDDAAPEIFVNFSTQPLGYKEDTPIYPAYMILFLAATDRMTGVEKMLYQIDVQPKKRYQGLIEGWKKGEKYEVAFFVSDPLGNEATKKVTFYVE